MKDRKIDWKIDRKIDRMIGRKVDSYMNVICIV